MAKEKPTTGKRTRRTRQQMLLESEAALSNGRKFPTFPIYNKKEFSSVDRMATVLSEAQNTSTMEIESSGGNGNQKKSLRLLFQNAKSGKGLHRQKKNKNYRWPRTVEAARSPFIDPTGKNKMFFVLAINLYPENKIVQPSDSETTSEDEENNEPSNWDSDHHPSSPNPSSSPVDVKSDSTDVVNIDADEAFFHEKSPSPVSPKVKRGRRPTNARRIPYGRAADIDHSWRSNYNRRCVQRRTHKQARNRIKDPEVILDVINTVVQRYSVGIELPNSFYKNANDANVDNKCAASSLTDNHRVTSPPRTPPKDLMEENLIFIKQEITTPEPSDVEVDVEDDEEEYVSVENDDPSDKDYVALDFRGKSYGDYERDEDEYDDEDEDSEILEIV